MKRWFLLTVFGAMFSVHGLGEAQVELGTYTCFAVARLTDNVGPTYVSFAESKLEAEESALWQCYAVASAQCHLVHSECDVVHR